LANVVDTATAAHEEYNYTRALEVTETFFWTFCDDYLELVKDRAYGGAYGNATQAELASAGVAPTGALHVLLGVLAPGFPLATEEVWSWWREGSIHAAAWPTANHLPTDGEPALIEAAGEALAALRKKKSEAKASQRTPYGDVSLAT